MASGFPALMSLMLHLSELFCSQVKSSSPPDPGILPGLQRAVHGGIKSYRKVDRSDNFIYFSPSVPHCCGSFLTNPLRFGVNPPALGIFECRYLRDLNGHH